MDRMPLDLAEQHARFAGFVAFAHEMGARGVRDGRARVVSEGASRSVVLEFSHDDFPGVRFGHRCKLSAEDRHEALWLAEELATGALHSMMRYDQPEADEHGIVWTRLHGQLLGPIDDASGPALVRRALPVEATRHGATCGIYAQGDGRGPPHACRSPAVAKRVGAGFDRVRDTFGHRVAQAGALYVGACSDHLEELERRAEASG